MHDTGIFKSLKTLLTLDAATCFGMGAVLMAAPGPVGALTALPAPFLFWAGASLMPVAAFMGWSAKAREVPVWAASAIVLGNLLWVIASIALPAMAVVQPNALGWAFLIAQATVVALFAALEFEAMRGRAVAA